jgi:hypothetical protein
MGNDRNSERGDLMHSPSKRILVRCLVAASIVLLPGAGWWGIRYCRVERAIRNFASNPSQAQANKLTVLLNNRSLTRGQAARTLKLLLWPTVATRSAYSVGRKPTISTTLPCYLHFPTGMTCRVDVHAGGQIRSTAYPAIQFGTAPEVWVCPVAPDRPGKLRMEIQYEYLLRPPSPGAFYFQNPLGRFLSGLLARMKIRPWLPPPEKKWYQVRFQVPVEIDVVEAAQAEQVQLLSDPELDRRMRDVLRPEVWSSAPGGPDALYVTGQVLPANVAFRCFLELPDGTRIMPYQPELCRLRGYAGWDFAVSQPLGNMVSPESGTQQAKFVFEADPNYALDEPTLKSIWNGRLEFPIRFPAPPEPNARR